MIVLPWIAGGRDLIQYRTDLTDFQDKNIRRRYFRSQRGRSHGLIEGGKDPGTGKFNYHCAVKARNQQEDLLMKDIPELVYAVCAVESYDVNDRQRDYPSAPITISQIDLQVDPTSPQTIDWSTNRNVGHDFRTSSDDGGQTIEFKVR